MKRRSPLARLAPLAAVVSVALAATLTGCPGSLEDPERFAGQFGACPDIPMLLVTSCAIAGCHTAQSPSAGLDLATADIATRLSGQKAAGGGLLVDPDAPDESVIYTKVTDVPPFGSRMPLGGTLFDDTTVACMLTWLETSTKGGSP